MFNHRMSIRRTAAPIFFVSIATPFGKMTFGEMLFGEITFGDLTFGEMAFEKMTFGEFSGHRPNRTLRMCS